MVLLFVSSVSVPIIEFMMPFKRSILDNDLMQVTAIKKVFEKYDACTFITTITIQRIMYCVLYSNTNTVHSLWSCFWFPDPGSPRLEVLEVGEKPLLVLAPDGRHQRGDDLTNQRWARVYISQSQLTWPMSAITERVKGMPTMANRMQNSRPGVVTGAKWPEHDNPIQL